jgi:ABC-type branched-subunit amino acid transport system substrate-binding protein
MSVVYLAEDLRLGRKVALKLLSPELTADAKFRERFLRESRLAASLDHSHVIPIYEAGEAKGALYIAMRYVEGSDLKSMLAEQGRLEPWRALEIARQVASALDAAHARGLVHRDVKPANILVTSEGDGEHVYLSDFGLTKDTSSESGLTETGHFVGTGDYMAPEQIQRKPVDGRADVYSLGCVLFECLTGRVPYPADQLMAVLWAHVNEPPPRARELRLELPASLDRVFAKALAKDPARRYPTCRALVEAARKALPAEDAPAPPRRRLRRVFIAGVLVAAAAALAAGLLLTRGGGGAHAGASSDTDRIVIGISAAKTGALAPYDVQAAQAFMIRIDEINQAGGVLGKRLHVEWLDSKSDWKIAGRAARNADVLVSRGAVAIVASCDVDFALPAVQVARRHKVLGMSLCADHPSAADPSVVGPYGGSMGEGADAVGAGMAEWLRRNRPQWKRAYVLRDRAIRYTLATADYFAARWKQLGGTISGVDTFKGPGNSPNPGALTQQVRNLRDKVEETDVVYDASFSTGAATFIRQTREAGIDLPIATNTGVDGRWITAYAGPVSDVYSMSTVCVPRYCSGAVTRPVQHFFASFFEEHGALANSFSTYGYDLATALVEAIRRAKSTDSTKIAKALFSGLTIQTLAGPVTFTVKCHRPQPASYVFERYTNGKAKALGRVSTHNIPIIGDGNPCAGSQVRVTARHPGSSATS